MTDFFSGVQMFWIFRVLHEWFSIFQNQEAKVQVPVWAMEVYKNFDGNLGISG